MEMNMCLKISWYHYKNKFSSISYHYKNKFSSISYHYKNKFFFIYEIMIVYTLYKTNSSSCVEDCGLIWNKPNIISIVFAASLHQRVRTKTDWLALKIICHLYHIITRTSFHLYHIITRTSFHLYHIITRTSFHLYHIITRTSFHLYHIITRTSYHLGVGMVRILSSCVEDCGLIWNKPNIISIVFAASRHSTKIYGSKVFLLTFKIKPEYSYIMYNPTHFPGLVSD
jgi:hypothetical protein